jgi:recombination associated protein RdgC
MFKNATVFGAKLDDTIHLSERLDKFRFCPTGPTQAASIGFVPPRGLPNSPLVEIIANHALLCVMTETRSVPAATLKKAVDAQAAKIEQDTGRKPGKKMRLELKETALLELLPQAFPKQVSTWVWFDKKSGRLVIDSASASRCDDIASLLVRAIDGLKVSILPTEMSPSSIMTGWLHDKGCDFDEFSIGRQAQLEAQDETRSKVSYANHSIDTDEVQAHIRGGKYVTRLALTWKGRVSFVLDHNMVLGCVQFEDVATESSREHVDGLDADFAIVTGELAPMIDDLLAALGGVTGG